MNVDVPDLEKHAVVIDLSVGRTAVVIIEVSEKKVEGILDVIMLH